MPFIKIWIHTVWATKDRQPYLLKEIRQQVFQHIMENSRAKGIHVDHINGHTVSGSHSQIEKSENIFKTKISIIRKKHFNRNMTNLLRNMVLLLL